MSKEQVRKAIENLERSGKMRNVILVKKAASEQINQLARTLQEGLDKLKSFENEIEKVARSTKDGDFSNALQKVKSEVFDQADKMAKSKRELLGLSEKPEQ